MLVQSSKQELAERIAQALPRDGTSEPRPGVHLYRRSRAGERVYAFERPTFCVIAQGSKEIFLGASRFRCDPAHYLITTMELPLAGQVVTASPARPYLSCKVVLDPAVVTSAIVESGHVAPTSGGGARAIDTREIDPDLLDATLRLVRLLENPGAYRVLAPLVTREIIHRLLMGDHLVPSDGRARRMERAVTMIRQNFAKPLRVETVARAMGMSVSGFHAHFKAVTGMSPLQFQKTLRLEEARLILVSERADVAEVGYRVGYDDPSHFSREYKRHFGEPPLRDVRRLHK